MTISNQKLFGLQEDDIFTWQQYKELYIDEERFLLEPWLISPSYSLLVAKRGLGKSWFSLAVAMAVASGTDMVHWHPPEPQGVLYIDGEMSSRQLQDRINGLAKGLPHIDENLYVLSVPHMVKCEKEPVSLAQEAWRREIRIYLKGHPYIKLVVFDNVSCLFSGLDENDKQQWDEPDAFFVALRSRGISSIVVHHTGKEASKGQRGSSSREDHVDVSLRLSGVSGHNPTDGCKLVTHFSKARCVHGEAIKSMQLDLEDIDGRLQFVQGEATELQHKIMELHDSSMQYSVRQIADMVGCSKTTVQKTISRAKYDY